MQEVDNKFPSYTVQQEQSLNIYNIYPSTIMMIKLSMCGGGGIHRKLTQIDNKHGNQKEMKELCTISNNVLCIKMVFLMTRDNLDQVRNI